MPAPPTSRRTRQRPALTAVTQRAERERIIMSQIMYNYPAMLGYAGEMSGFAGVLQAVGADIASEQAALSNAWAGDTSITYQVWQAQWNQAMEDLVRAYRAMAGTHETNTMSMLARDQAECAKWG
jgi:WXG100 family type VII secretion target